jgi:hypothetical protein
MTPSSRWFSTPSPTSWHRPTSPIAKSATTPSRNEPPLSDFDPRISVAVGLRPFAPQESTPFVNRKSKIRKRARLIPSSFPSFLSVESPLSKNCQLHHNFCLLCSTQKVNFFTANSLT